MTEARKKQVRTAATAFALLVLCLGLASCRRQAGQTVSAVGSTSVQPFAEILADEFHRIHRDIEVEVQGGGSTAGVQALLNNIADIGMCSRNLSADEAAKAKPIVIARDGLAIVVHPTNPVSDLSVDNIRRIFSGELTNWKQVPGGVDGVIRPITREEGSGTREAFQKMIMGKMRFSRKALTQESNGSVKELVRHDPAAIGYMSLGLVEDLKALRVGGVEATAANVVAGKYKLVRPFLFVVHDEISPAARLFIDYVLSDEGQKHLEKEGLVRAK